VISFCRFKEIYSYEWKSKGIISLQKMFENQCKGISAVSLKSLSPQTTDAIPGSLDRNESGIALAEEAPKFNRALSLGAEFSSFHWRC